MFGLDFNNLRDLALIDWFFRERWHVEQYRTQYASTNAPSHKRAYLRWQVVHLRELDKCYDVLAAR